MGDGQAYVANVPVKGPKSIDRPKTMKLHPCTRKEKRPSKQTHALRGMNIATSKLLHGSLTSCSTWKHKLAHYDPHCCILLCNSTQVLSHFYEYPRVQIVARIISTFLDGTVQLTTMFFTSPCVSTSRCCGNTTQSTKREYGCEQSKRVPVNEYHACFAPKTSLFLGGQPRETSSILLLTSKRSLVDRKAIVQMLRPSKRRALEAKIQHRILLCLNLRRSGRFGAPTPRFASFKSRGRKSMRAKSRLTKTTPCRSSCKVGSSKAKLSKIDHESMKINLNPGKFSYDIFVYEHDCNTSNVGARQVVIFSCFLQCGCSS